MTHQLQKGLKINENGQSETTVYIFFFPIPSADKTNHSGIVEKLDY